MCPIRSVELFTSIGGIMNWLAKNWVEVVKWIALAVVGGLLGVALDRAWVRVYDASTPDLSVSLYMPPYSTKTMDVVVPTRPGLVGTKIAGNAGAVVTKWSEVNGGGSANSVSFDLLLFGTVDNPVIVEGVSAKATCTDPTGDRTRINLQQSGPFTGKKVAIDLDAA